MVGVPPPKGGPADTADPVGMRGSRMTGWLDTGTAPAASPRIGTSDPVGMRGSRRTEWLDTAPAASPRQGWKKPGF